MSDAVLYQIEKTILELPADEQLLLISRVVDKLRKTAQNEAEFEARLAEMAADKQVQAELRRIEDDFAATELDGLAK